MNKNILLLDTSFSAKPIYDFLLKTGNQVFVLGNKPDDALAKLANNYFNINYAKISEVELFIKKNKIDYLVPGGNDFSYKVCSILNQKLNYFNIDSKNVYENINNKEKFRKFALENSLNVPLIIPKVKIKDNLPVIIKPVDAYSGHGVTVIRKNDSRLINKAINKALKFSNSNQYLIEKFVEGQLHSHSAFLSNGKIIQDFIVEEHCTVNPFVVDTSRVIFNFKEDLLKQIRKNITKLAKALNISDGLIHTQFISNDKDFWIIEVTRRCPGDLYSRLIEESTGFPYAEFYARPFLNKKNKMKNLKLKKNNVIRHTITLSKEQIFNSIKLNKPIDNFELVILAKTGDKLQKSPLSRVGIVFTKAKNKKEADILFEKFKRKKIYSIN